MLAKLIPVIAVAFAVVPALADHRVRRLDADIDDLDAELFITRDGWDLVVEYEVEVDPWHPSLDITLHLNARERGALLRDSHGRPIEIAVSLSRPREFDDGEATFRGRVRIGLPRRAICDPEEIRLYAAVHWAGGDRPLDRDDESVDFRRR